MRKLKILSILAINIMMLCVACGDYFEPNPNNEYDENRILNEAAFAEGLLLTPYAGLPAEYSFEEAATDDAVTNEIGRSFKRMATGEWSSQFNPLAVWGSAYKNIFYLNLFLSMVNDVKWSTQSTVRKQLFAERFAGEAYGLRAWYYFDILKKHGGLAKDGNMLGFIIIDKYQDPATMDRKAPRNTYEDCVQFILDDCNRALEILPMDYKNFADADSNMVYGPQNKNRVSGRVIKALKSRLLLHAASPAFNLTNDAGKWEMAAQAAAELLKDIGGVAGLSSSGLTWFTDENHPEIIWRRDRANILTWEQKNFPPSQFGNGRDNPSQNLVDAFPMANGYPITHETSGYNPVKPYADRDTRLTEYIIYNGNRVGRRIVINTNVESPNDGINNTLLSTKTGYYIRKPLNGDVRLIPGAENPRMHFYTIFRYTEIFLNYAEAANEIWGPDADPNNYGFTPRQIIAAIRNRAKIKQPDTYLESISDKEEMRKVIQNERRIELCFEGFRFWDLRRWNMNLNETVKGMHIEAGVHSVIDVEERAYLPYMKYPPIPYRDILNNENIIQNEGW